MPWYCLTLEAIVLLAFWLSLGVSQKDRSTPGRATFVGLALSVAAWSLAELAEARELVDVRMSDRLGYAGAMALPALWVGLAAQTTGTEAGRRVPWIWLLLLAPQLPLYAMLYAGPWGAIFLSYSADGSVVPGPLWWASVAYAWLCSAAGTLIFVLTAIRWRQRGRWVQRLLLGVTSLAPIGSNIAYVLGGMPWSWDPTPLLLGAALLVLRYAVFSGGLLQALPISQYDLMHQFPLGVVLADRAGTVIEMNPSAERQLGIPEREALGRTLEAVLDRAEGDLRIDVCPIRAADREVGQLALIEHPAKPD